MTVTDDQMVSRERSTMFKEGLTKDGLAHEPVDGEEEVLDVLIH